MSENLNPFELPGAKVRVTHDLDTGKSTVDFRDRAEEFEMYREAAGHYVVTPQDADQRIADETTVMARGFPPEYASSPWFAQRVREENNSE